VAEVVARPEPAEAVQPAQEAAVEARSEQAGVAAARWFAVRSREVAIQYRHCFRVRAAPTSD
jgi:hypothetical protein